MVEEVLVLGFWPYRAAMAMGERINFPREHVKDLEEHLLKQAGKRPDNKYTFKIATEAGIRYITFYDFTCYIGTEVSEAKPHLYEEIS